MSGVRNSVLLLAVAMAGLAWCARPTPTSEAIPEPTPAVQPAATTPAAPVLETPPVVEVGAHPLAALLDGPEVAPQLGKPGFVRGRLAWQGSRVPIIGATVRAVRAWPDTVVVNDVERRGQERLPRDIRELFVGEPAVTDASGRFEVAGVTEVDGPLSLLALNRGACLEARPLQPGPPPGGILELADWLLAPRGALRGQVLDQQGTPLPDARVRFVDVPLEGGAGFHPLARAARLWGAREFTPGCLMFDGKQVLEVGDALEERDALLPFPETRTDARGQFLLTGARPGAGLLIVHGYRRAGVSLQVYVPAVETTDLGQIKLTDGGLRGRVVRSPGDPEWDGVEVSVMAVTSDVFPPPVRTDRTGGFLLPGFDGVPLLAAVRMEPSLPWVLAELEEDPDGVTVYAWDRHESRNVQLEDDTGAPVTGARVEFRRRRAFDGGFDDIVALVERWRGIYRGPLDRAVETVLVARTRGFAPLVGLMPEEPVPPLRFVRPTFTVTFIVRDAHARAVPGASISARFAPKPAQSWRTPTGWDNDHLLQRGYARLGETDAAGALTCKGLWETDLDVVATHAEHGADAQRLRPIAAAPSPVFTLAPATRGRLVGRLTENGQTPGTPWLVVAACEALQVRRLTMTGPDGTFAFQSLPTGLWQCDVVRRVGPLGAAPLLGELVRMQYARGWPQAATAPVQILAGAEVHTRLECRRWVEDLDAPLRHGRVRIDGEAAAGLAVREFGVGSNKRESLHPLIERRLQDLSIASWRTRDRLAADRTAGAPILERSLAPVGAVVETDARGAFRFDTLRWHEPGAAAFEVIALVDGVEQRLWAGLLAAGQSIDIETGSISLEVRDRGGMLLRNRAFAAAGLDTLRGVRLLGAADRHGILTLLRAPRGEYDLRLLGTGTDVAFASPAFRVTGRGPTHASVSAH